jgi:phosphoglycerate dehydrogenase-like enzyme
LPSGIRPRNDGKTLNMRVVFRGLPHHSPVVPQRLRTLDWIDLAMVDDEPAAAREAASADVLIVTPSHYSDAVERAVVKSGRLRLVQLLSAGYDALAGRQFAPETIVATAGDALAPAVAEHAVALALALVRRLDVAVHNQAGQKWDRGPFHHIGSLEGSTAAVVGFGAIGKAVATRLRAFGMHVIGVSRSGAPHHGADEMAGITDLDRVLERSDLVVITLPGSPETENMFSRARIANFRRGAILINVARGKIVDGLALAEALDSGRLAGAGLDVTQPEPLPSEHPLWRARNAIITPHYGGIGGQQRLSEFIAENLRRLHEGRPLAAVVELGGRG